MQGIIGFLAGSALATLLAVPAVATPASGLHICRKEGFVQNAQTKIDREAIRLPSLIGFDDWGREGDQDFMAHKWALTVMTLKPIEIARGQRCVVVPAKITRSSKVRSVSANDHRHFEVDGIFKIDGTPNEDARLPPGWDAVLDLDVRVVGTVR